jgi:hypothetical protein
MSAHRMTSMLLAGALIVTTLITGMGVATQAAAVTPARPKVVPQPATFYEIFPSFILPATPKCLDVPSNSTKDGEPLNIFHCHSGANQLWEFFNMGNNIYQIQNKNSGLCLEVPTTTGTPGTLVEQGSCNQGGFTEWQVNSPIVANNFNLASVQFPTECMAASNASDPQNTATRVRIDTCSPGNIFNQNTLQTWQLG